MREDTDISEKLNQKSFFTKLAFSFNIQYDDSEQNVALAIGDNNVIVMLFTEHLFKRFSGHGIANTNQAVEVLFCVYAEVREARLQ